MWAGDPFDYNSSLFPLRNHGSDPWGTAWDGAFGSADGTVGDWYGRDQDPLGLCVFPTAQVLIFSVYFLSGFMDFYDCHAGSLLLVCQKKVHQTAENGRGIGCIERRR